MIIQKITHSVADKYELAYKYFSILSVINNLELVKRDLQLIAYSVSMEKDVSEVKKDFIKKFGSSIATIGNIISKLYKINILEKHKRVVKINPQLLIDFDKDLGLALIFRYGDKG